MTTDRGSCPEQQCRHHGQDSGVEVEQRKRAIENVIGTQLEVLDHELCLADRVAVGEDAALGRTGGAGREHHHRRVELVDSRISADRCSGRMPFDRELDRVESGRIARVRSVTRRRPIERAG